MYGTAVVHTYVRLQLELRFTISYVKSERYSYDFAVKQAKSVRDGSEDETRVSR